ncbi:MAG: LacI family DNA-binding transcriptional regulator [Burkholderiales bacterium]|nr:LacI family DNA-binding transcriptional regulator [Burkholderiales bacterium]
MALTIKPGASPTITDVAQQAGVSIKTVSRVMNGEAGVRPDTREQVLAVMAALKYRPKQSARSLAGARSFLIGLLYFDPSAAFVAGVQQGASLSCREAGCHLVVESLHNDAPDLEQQVERMVHALRPDGMILTPPLCDNAQVIKALRDSQTPYVLVSPARDTAGVLSVRMDDAHAAEEITNLLIGLGHQRIAFIQGPASQAASRLRYQGYKRALKRHRMALDETLVHAGDFTFESGVAAAHRLLSNGPRPTAVFAGNDDMALGVLVTAQRLGVGVPSELSIAGFDDSPACGLVWPPLTTVHQPKDEMARAAVAMLTAASRGDTDAASGPGAHRVLPHRLVVRESTAAPRPAGARKAGARRR